MKIILVCMMLTVLSWSAHGALIRVSDEQTITDLSNEPSLVLEVVDGQLLGAFNIEINGALYDVSFVDGTCIALFSGCDSTGDFFWPSYRDVIDASLALFIHVFADSAIGNFDSDPSLTRGCENDELCIVVSPLAVLGDSISMFASRNSYSQSDGYNTISAYPSTSSQDYNQYTYAIWSNARVVSTPSTLAILLLGLLGLILHCRARL